MLAKSISLATVSPGKEVRVVSVIAGRGLAQRLADMGLLPGTVLKVVNRHGAGPTLVEFRGARLALGYGVSQKIMVEKTGG